MSDRAYQYVVTGFGEFPADMLRYDVADYATLADEQKAKNERRTRHIQIVGEHPPTDARWASFLWSVSKVERLARKART